MRTHFEKARVCVLRRTIRPPQLEPWAEEALRNGEIPVALEVEPEFEYEVVAWPPGTVDGGMLPQVGDEISLPGYETPFRVVERALHWPAPSSTEGRMGELQVNLAVEAVGANSLNSPPWGRPGEKAIREEGRWLLGRVASFEPRTSFGGTQYVRVDFAIDGVGTLSRQIVRNWQALEMFPDWAGFQNGPSHQEVSQNGLMQCLRTGQEFEVRVAPSDLPSDNGRLQIWEVRPPKRPESADLEPWANEANEITTSNSVRGGQL